jgi:exopolyphosphatase / guanosine-5'-triphosphate,3'-diphosphate pyrophosphatase
VLVEMGGAVTNIAAVKHGLAKYDPNIVQGSVIERAESGRSSSIALGRWTIAAQLSDYSRRGLT